MKVKRNLFLASLCVLFLVCYYIMNQTYDELARYPYATEENHDLILHYLDEKDIDFLLAQNVKPEQFLPYVECAGFQLEHTLWYDKAMQLQPADASYIVQFIETWKNEFTFHEMDTLLSAYLYADLAVYFENGDPFVEYASLMVDPSDLLSDLHAETSVYTYVPADLVALKELPHVNVNSTDKEVYVREAMVKPLEALSEAMSEACGVLNYDLIIVSGYVSYEEQKQLYQNALLQYGADQFLQYEDYPGHSEKQLGYTVRFAIAGVSDLQTVTESEQAKWLREHAYEYGFIVRYPSGKEAITQKQAQPLTLRYVGEEAAKEMRDHDWTWEEWVKRNEQ